ncbi:hypothetical protein MNB_SV-10-1391 [hydrothermal vent metagenome]|uniref:Uncharacterized protein n=1 Tax=hydrothermal vent metagenome TaxID=652676 RepID=A0A1W1BX58_9ZZZZ|nr:hypothetical protein [Sulfurovum sp.]
MAEKVKTIQVEMCKYYKGYQEGCITKLEYIELTSCLNFELKKLVADV